MTLAEQVAAQVRFLAPELVTEETDLLNAVCQAAVSSLRSRLREDLEPEECLSDFVTAAGLYAAAALAEIGDLNGVEQFTAGDLTVRRGGGHSAAEHLRQQAAMLMAPYTRSGFSFLGV